MKYLLVKIPILLAGVLTSLVIIFNHLLTIPIKARTIAPPPQSKQQAVYFADLEVVEIATRRKLNTGEVMELLDRLPTVKTVTLPIDPPRPFSIETLAYPQFEYRYTLTHAEWDELQAYCRAKLMEEPLASDNVRNHWRRIVNGATPFGLQVREY
jgi:hypothetical protein